MIENVNKLGTYLLDKKLFFRMLLTGNVELYRII